MLNKGLAALRSWVLNALPGAVIDRLRALRKRSRLRRKRAEQVAWIVRGFGAGGRARVAGALFRRWVRPRRRVLFYPKHPTRGSVLYKACVLLGYATTVRPDRPHDVAVRYGNKPADRARLGDIPGSTRILNVASNDISKTTVAAVFERVFGYPLAVDPTTYEGRMVEKSDANATHDGRLVEGPVPAESVRAGRVYQKAVDNVARGGEHTIDLRVPLIGDRIPLVYKKWRAAEDRFGRDSERVLVLDTDEALSAEEQAGIVRLGREMGVDLAEMDVLRDNRDGRVYVVDVNNTPNGPARGLSREGRVEAMERISRGFELAVEGWIREGPVREAEGPARPARPAG